MTVHALTEAAAKHMRLANGYKLAGDSEVAFQHTRIALSMRQAAALMVEIGA